MKKRWDVIPQLAKEDKQHAKRLASQLNCPLVIAELLYHRHLLDTPEIDNFFHPTMEMLHDPFLFKDMERAVERILTAVDKGEKITIYGDYDVDGTTATAVLCLGLRQINANVDYMIPHRMLDGYGLSISALAQLQQNGTALIITVDCGIISFDEVNAINEMGMQVIITDHHNPKNELPPAYAIINPKMENSGYPFSDLAGVGVAYKLLMAIYQKLGIDTPENRMKYLDLVAIGTVADIVSLTDENRAIAHFGLKHLEQKHNVGMKELMEVIGFAHKTIDTNDIIFNLAPRINVAGRMGSAMRAVDLMTSSDPAYCRQLAETFDSENTQRQQIDLKTYSEACELVDKKYKDIKETFAIVIASDEWHQGILGIISSKLIERYYRPTIIISNHAGIGNGSGRSVDEFDLYAAIEYSADLLDSYGGHKYAVGLTILPEYLELFENKINDYFRQFIDLQTLIPPLKIDKMIEIYQINQNFMDWLYQFAPFGVNNQVPVFYTEHVKTQGYPYLVGKNHLKLKVNKDGCELDLIGYNLGDYLSFIKKDSYLDIAYTLDLVNWQGKTFIQGSLKDLKIVNM